MTRKDEHFELSVFKGELTSKNLVEMSLKLKQAFPSLPPDFYDIFADRIKEHNYNDDRLKAAINHVIDNCVYPTPTIAQFISFDKCIELYSYDDILKLNDINRNAFQVYKSVYLDGSKIPYYAHLNDIEKYKLTLWADR